MTLRSGTRLGGYEILAPLGAGGMGEVYRAHDTKLRREVALKVLPEALAADPDRLSRFTREAHMLATLNHPNIAAIYGVEDSGSIHALVLELVEGQTLAERIADEGRGLPVPETLAIARQIAEALEAAHEKGVIHRDLKPANIKVTPEDRLKVLDFGLAKALSEGAAPGDLSNSPTLSTGTNAGTILGTPAYMSPEQAQGKAVDKRADIWAFGCVLFEMLTGRRAFRGEHITDVLVAVMTGEPDWTALPPATAPRIVKLLRRCLKKDPRERLRDIGDARIEIEEALTGEMAPAPVGEIAVVRSSNRARLIWGGVGLMAGAIVAALAIAVLAPGSNGSSPQVARVLIGVASADGFTPEPTRTSVVFSPDGKFLVFSATKGGRQQLYLRAMDRLEATPLPGTEGSNSPFFSPNGQSVGFWVGTMGPGAVGQLKTVPIDGGPAVTVCATSPLFGVSWGLGDLIVFANGGGGLWSVPAAGGMPQPLTTPDAKKRESSHRLPHFLPGGKAVLFTIETGDRPDEGQIAVRSLVTGKQEILIEGGADARYVPTGHLVYAHAGTLMATPFDLARLKVTGLPSAILEGVMQAVNTGFITLNDTGAAQFSLSESGALVYIPGGIFPDRGRSLVWMDRNGTATPVGAPPRPYLGPRLSPDGKRFAVGTIGLTTSVWIYSFTSGTMTRLTPEGESFWPTWTPDGTRVTVNATGPTNLTGSIVSMPADGGLIERLTAGGNAAIDGQPGSWSPDGQLLAFVKALATTGRNIWVLSPGVAEQKLRPSLQTPFLERFPAFSPAGDWLAYVSDESGRDEVYVQRYPGSGERHQVSAEGGSEPSWTKNGRELFYSAASEQPNMPAKMMVVDITLDPTFTASKPRVLFEGQYRASTPLRNYDVTPDGKRFLMVQTIEPPPVPPLTHMVVVLNYFEELKRRRPAGK